MPDTNPAPLLPTYVLEGWTPFERSALWEQMRRYFSERGPQAWASGEVPSYVTTSPVMGRAYAEMILAFARDLHRQERPSAPLTIVELGAGAGRLAFNVLSRLQDLCEREEIPLESFRYVMTDFNQTNPDFWKAHPSLKGWMERGILDVSLFDATVSDHLELQVAGTKVEAGALETPLVVLANYLLDSLPHELYHLKGGQVYVGEASLIAQGTPGNDIDSRDVMNRLQLRCRPQVQPREPGDNPLDERILEDYLSAVEEGWLLFPRSGLRCMDRLRALSRQGMLLLTADKGYHQLSAQAFPEPPSLVKHGGAFSLNANYHAYRRYFELQGGQAAFTHHRHRSIDVGCLLLVEGPGAFRLTRRAFAEHVQDFGPDDFQTLFHWCQEHAASLGAGELLALLRLSRSDPQQLLAFLPRLQELAPQMVEEERRDLEGHLERSLPGHYALPGEFDLDFHVGCLYYLINRPSRALERFQASRERFGDQEGTLHNITACQERLGLASPARKGEGEAAAS